MGPAEDKLGGKKEVVVMGKCGEPRGELLGESWGE